MNVNAIGDEELLEYVIERDFEDTACRIILEAVKRSENGIGKRRLARVLRGSDPGYIISSHPEMRELFGRLDLLSEDQLADFFESLVRLGALDIEGVDFPRLRITGKGKRSMRSKSLVPAQIPWPLPTKEIPIPRDMDLFDRLKEERNRLAREEEMPPYCIATNINLVEMVNRDIQDERDISEIKGMGSSRAEKYGHYFLEILAS